MADPAIVKSGLETVGHRQKSPGPCASRAVHRASKLAMRHAPRLGRAGRQHVRKGRVGTHNGQRRRPAEPSAQGQEETATFDAGDTETDMDVIKTAKDALTSALEQVSTAERFRWRAEGGVPVRPIINCLYFR